jgi:hypothetical protein
VSIKKDNAPMNASGFSGESFEYLPYRAVAEGSTLPNGKHITKAEAEQWDETNLP